MFGAQSLFSAAAAKSNKPKSNVITINFSESNLHKLVQTALNLSIPASVAHWSLQHPHHHQKLEHFDELFNVNKFNKELVDYSTFYECRKQLQQTGFKASEPMCLLNLESGTSPASTGTELDYDYYDAASVLTDDHFNVQTAFEQQIDRSRSTASFYLASACQKRKRPIRNSNQFGSLSKDFGFGFTPLAKVKYQVRLNENRISAQSHQLSDTTTGKTSLLLYSMTQSSTN